MSTTTPDTLNAYQAKRNFAITPEPAAGGQARAGQRSFVIQKHWASSLHYDFRLELDGSMKSWAVPKGPSFDTKDKRMAVQVEDHPISYNTFEGEIPAGQYGAGKVIIWDKGIWTPVGDPIQGYRDGNLKFELAGHKLHGRWVLVRMKGKGEKQPPWLLIKEKDAFARPSTEYSVVDELPDSVATQPLRGKQDGSTRTPATATKKTAAKKAAAKKVSTRGAGVPAGAVRADLPQTLKPQLATLVDTPPGDADDWIYEIKFDGYRMLTRVEGGDIKLITRNGHDWSPKLPALLAALKKMKLPNGWYDGEITVLDDHGIPDFQALQNAFDTSSTQDIVYFLFDLPFYKDLDLRAASLVDRRALLKTRFNKRTPDIIRFSDTFEAAARDVVTSACKLGLEGVIGKKKDSAYTARRSGDWIKLKCGRRQEFVIGGYTDPQGSRTGIGSLLLGVHDEQGKLQYAGNVGTGFSEKTLTELKMKLDALASRDTPFAGSTGIDRKAHWVKPDLLAEVAFGEWTNTGRIRHSVFHGLRTDKKAAVITRERATPMSTSPVPDTILPPTLKVTHPERVIDDSTHITKLDLIRYYALVAPLLLPHLKGRPVSLVRAPDGITGELFFQKHMEAAKMPGVKALPQSLDPGHAPLIEITTAEGVLSANQMNVIEFHTWNAVKTAIGKPDRMTFDLDPGEGVPWAMMQEAAHVMRSMLEQLEIRSFVKTSGGKGLHVVVPLQRRYDWDTVKDFSQAIVQHLAKTLPKRFVAKSGPRNRVGKIFVDYLRNGFGATTVAAWSARSRPGLGVSVPIRWDEVDSLTRAAQWTVQNIHTRLDQGNAPWNDYAASAQAITAGMRILRFTPKK